MHYPTYCIFLSFWLLRSKMEGKTINTETEEDAIESLMKIARLRQEMIDELAKP